MTENQTTVNDDDQQLIKLCLKKPKRWNWELTTSKSSSSIAFPTIQLFDEDNKTMLAEATDANFVASSKLKKSNSVSKVLSFRSFEEIDNFKFNSDASKEEIREPIITEPDENCKPKLDHWSPTQINSERGILLRDANTKEFKKLIVKPRTKVYSRSSSMRSVSILERISELKLDSSSEDDDDIDNDISYTKNSPSGGKLKAEYSFRTCNIGTIIVPKESFSKARRRPKRNESSATLKSESSVNLRQPRIIDSKQIETVKNPSENYLDDTKAVNPSVDEVFLLLVKRLASSLQYSSETVPQNCPKSLVPLNVVRKLAKKICDNDKSRNFQAINNCRPECGATTNRNIPEKSKFDEKYDSVDCNHQERINESIYKKPSDIETDSSKHNNKRDNMGSNVSTAGKGLSERRTQSSSNIDTNKPSITNGICCSTKYSKGGRKNSILSQQQQQQDGDRKPLNKNNENFTGIDQVIANANTGTLKPSKKSIQAKSCKDRKKIHGSLPNHLDTDADYEDSYVTKCSNVFPSNQTLLQHKVTQDNPQLSVIRKFDEIYQQQHRYQNAMQPFHHQKQQNHSFRITNTYKENFLRSQETNSFRIPTQAYGNRVKFLPVGNIITPNSPVQIIDQCYDQGYGSERSPEEEVPPPLPIVGTEKCNQLIVNMMPPEMLDNMNRFLNIDLQQKLFQQQTAQPNYDFVTEDCTFNVEIIKGQRGLGLSVSGGIDSNAPYPGLVRIKRIFPHQAAWATGKLQPGDILLEANGIILTGLTSNEALEVLRTMANVVNLLVCRPHDEHFRKLSPPVENPPVPPIRSSFNFKHQHYVNQAESILQHGEFVIILVKLQGSLGFTLQKEDDSVEGHYVRALVREPATTDGRIRAGDKILAVNDVPISSMTHEQAVIFMRQSPDTVKLRLYRDDGPTPSSSTMSPSDSDYKSYAGANTLNKRTKMNLRPEAINLLTDLASKKNSQASSDGNSNGSSFQSSPNTASPRNRLRKNIKCSITSAPDSDTNWSDSTLKSSDSAGNSQTYFISENTSGTMTPYSDSSADTLTVISQSNHTQYYDPQELVHIAPDDDDNEGYYDSDELEKLEFDGNFTDRRIKRPEFLNISGQNGSAPVVCRKPFQFSIATANAYELNNLDNTILDAPTSYKMGMSSKDHNDDGDGPNNFTSLPCETLLLACRTEDDLRNSPNNDVDTCLYVTKFKKQNPMYQSAQVSIASHKQNISDNIGGGADLLKWKSITMSTNDCDDDKCSNASSRYEEQPSTSSQFNSIQHASVRNSQQCLNMDELCIDSDEFNIITIEMNRRWSCRLGIRLEPQLVNDMTRSITVIKEICKDTLAERDGRLIPGDRILMINDEVVGERDTQDIIDMMRIIRGPLCITVARKIKS